MKKTLLRTNIPVVTFQQATDRLQTTLHGVRYLCRSGNLAYEDFLGTKVIRESDLEEYIARTRPDGTKPQGRPKKRALGSS